jgi:hypothetical protein
VLHNSIISIWIILTQFFLYPSHYVLFWYSCLSINVTTRINNNYNRFFHQSLHQILIHILFVYLPLINRYMLWSYFQSYSNVLLLLFSHLFASHEKDNAINFVSQHGTSFLLTVNVNPSSRNSDHRLSLTSIFLF